jgi:hypothetical protein
MVKFKVEKFKQEKKGWIEIIVDRINEGKVLPCISNVVSNNLVFGSHDDLVEGWAATFDFPVSDNGHTSLFDERKNLTLMTQYHSVMSKADPEIKADDRYIKEIYLSFLKEAVFSISDEDLVEELKADVAFDDLSFSEVSGRLNHPSDKEARQNPLLLLAQLPLPIYLTTSYHDVVEAALQKAGKKPRSEICYWNKNLKSIPSVFDQDRDYQPSKEEPLVYHLFGRDTYPDSLVLTEDDHLDFLVTISQDMQVLSPRLMQALADSSLVLLGYAPRSWDFRVLFRGLIKTSENQRRTKSVAIQIAANTLEKSYLVNYLAQEADFEIYWGDTLSFIQELYQRWSE